MKSNLQKSSIQNNWSVNKYEIHCSIALERNFQVESFKLKAQVAEQLDNVFGQRWGSWQMISLGLESVLISNPFESEGGAISGEGVRSLGNGTGLISDDFLLSALFHLDTIVGFPAVKKPGPIPSLIVNFRPFLIRHKWRALIKYDTNLKLYLPVSVSCSWVCLTITTSAWGAAAATAKKRATNIIFK